MGFAAFFGEEKPFQADRKDLKIVTRWCYNWRTNAGEKFQNIRKWVQSL